MKLEHRGFSIATYSDWSDLTTRCGPDHEAHFVVSLKLPDGSDHPWPRRYLPGRFASEQQALDAAFVAACRYVDGVIQHLEAIKPTASRIDGAGVVVDQAFIAASGHVDAAVIADVIQRIEAAKPTAPRIEPPSGAGVVAVLACAALLASLSGAPFSRTTVAKRATRASIHAMTAASVGRSASSASWSITATTST
jgi:hypothetical protein